MGQGIANSQRYESWNTAKALAEELKYWILKKTDWPFSELMVEIGGPDWQELTNQQLLERIQISRRKLTAGG